MDLGTTYLGMSLKHPIVPSASPLSHTLERMRALEDAGAAAIVMHSLFEEQIEQESRILDHFLDYGTYSFAEALDYFPEPERFNVGPDEYLELLHSAKSALDIPVIGSLNGVSSGGWTRYARLIQQAGADALELNLYHIATDQGTTSADVEQMYLDTVREVRNEVQIPLAVKVGPYFTAFAHTASRFRHAGADALVLFNRFYQPDFDLEALEVTPHLVLSTSHDLRLPLHWVALLYGRVPLDYAITSGVHTSEDVLKGLMAGANVTMMASELLSSGLGRIEAVLGGIRAWLEEREYASVAQLRGSMSMRNVANKDAFERANYMKVLQSWRDDPTGTLAN